MVNCCCVDNVARFSQKYEAEQLFSTLIIIIKVSQAVNQYFIMISEDIM